MDDLIDKVKNFITMHIGSSICLCSNDEYLLQWICPRVVEMITKEYLTLNEPGIDDIRYMIDFLYSAANDSYKIVFIHRAERILQEATNSMLKILEEPPFNSAIVLTTTRFTDLLPTVRSRVKTLNVFVDKGIFESLKERFLNHPKIDLILTLCKDDFEILRYIQQVEEIPSDVQFEESEFIKMFVEGEIAAQDRLKMALMLDDLYARFSKWTEKDLVQLYLSIMKNSDDIDLNMMVFLMCRILQKILELRGYRDVSTFKWLDSILTNRLMNFNGSLTLLNLLILIKKTAKR
jgi:hypothetical protein